jgi:hypothetical protein
VHGGSGGGKGSEDRHALWAQCALEKIVVGVGQGPGQVRLRHHLEGSLESKDDQQGPGGVTVTHPTLGVDHRLSLL